MDGARATEALNYGIGAKCGAYADFEVIRPHGVGSLEIVIRLATPHEIAACGDLCAAYLGGLRPDYESSLARSMAEPDASLWVALADRHLVAYGKTTYFRPGAGARENVAPEGHYLAGIVVSADARRRGVAEALTRRRLEWVFGRSSEAWYVSNAKNRASLRLHAKLGFEEVTRDFIYPGVSFVGGCGVLSRCSAEAFVRRTAPGLAQ